MSLKRIGFADRDAIPRGALGLACARMAHAAAVERTARLRRFEHYERRQVGVGLNRQTHLGAGRPIKHPRWNLQPMLRVGCSQVAAKDNTARPLDCLMNADPQAMDATDTAAPKTRYRGRSQALLYKTIRPHASLGYKPPAPEVFVPAFAAWPAALRRLYVVRAFRTVGLAI